MLIEASTMMGAAGPFGGGEMGGMFSILKVRKHQQPGTQARITTRACASFSNQCSFKQSPRNLPLKRSMLPFCVGEMASGVLMLRKSLPRCWQ
jgi:hypothetical protein